MISLSIDRDKCRKCGMCVSVCPVDKLERNTATKTTEVNANASCIECGHCVAICPQRAIQHSEFPLDKVQAIQTDDMPSPQQVLTLLKSRRSIRAFRDKPLDEQTIETIIDGARYAPSGHNSQSTEYCVVQDKDVLNQVSSLVIEYLKFEIKRFGNPFFRSMALLASRESAESGLHEIPRFRQMIASYESGTDPILNDAPALLAFHARRTIGFSDVNAQLALQNASLAAHSLGIGHFYTGWVIAPCRAPMAKAWNRRIPDVLGIPSGNDLYGALALGYPIPRFRNLIERKPSRIMHI